MRVIKFRGQTVRKETVYGDLLRINGRAQIYDGAYHFVKPETVAQLIGVDVAGEEIYEGDVVKRVKEWSDEATPGAMPMKAEFDDYAAILSGEIIKFG